MTCMYSGRCQWELDATYPEDTFNSVQSVQFIARLKCALVEDVRDLQVDELVVSLAIASRS